MSNIQLTTLDNGLRIVTDCVPSVDSIALGVWAGVGSRFEKPEVNGAAHMVEHMLFKGTEKRSAQDIVEVIENVGGHMNAYTSREITSYHIHLMKNDMPLALDVLADMYTNSTLPEDELKKERHVILQEIGMCNDTPDDLIFDHYYETAFADQAVGRAILGPSDIVASMKRESLQNHIDNFYTAEGSVISAAGNVDHDAFVAQVQEHFSGIKSRASITPESAIYTGGEKKETKTDLEQAHIVLGFDGVSRFDPDHFNVRALATVLGGGMSSRLFQEVREKRGLVYSVFSFYQALQDGGPFGIYAGTGPDDVTELMPVLCDEVQKVQHDIREEEITRVKAQLKSSLLLSRESMMTRADSQAKSILQKGKIFNQDDQIAKLDSITVQSVQAAAKKVFSTAPTLVGIGPLQNLESLDAIKARLKS